MVIRKGDDMSDSYRIFLVLLFALINLAASSLLSADDITIEYVGSTLWKQANDVAISGNYAYCAMGYGLYVLDISTPSSPAYVSKLKFSRATKIRISDDLAYLIAVEDSSGVDEYCLYLVDISSPENPAIAGTYQPAAGHYIRSVAAEGSYAYLAVDTCYPEAQGYDRIVTLNISNSGSPQFVSSFDTTGRVANVAVAGGMCYAVFSGFGMVALAHSGSVITGVYESDRIGGVELEGSYALVWGSGYVEIVDISNPATLLGRGSIDLYVGPPQSGIMDVAALGTKAYVGYGSTMRVIDFSDPDNPDTLRSYVFSLDPNARVRGVEINGDHVFSIVQSIGLKVIDVSDPTSLDLAGSYDMDGSLNAVVVDGDYAYVANRQWVDHRPCAIDIVDISNPASPSVVAHLDSVGQGVIKQLIKVDSLLYMTSSSDGLIIANVADLLSPALVGSYADTGLGRFTISDSVVYVTFDNQGLISFDVSDPFNPIPLDTFLVLVDEESVAVAGDYVYLALEAGIMILDVTQPENMVLAQTLDDRFYYDVVANNGYLYAATGDSLFVFDVSTDPANPSGIGNCRRLDHERGLKSMTIRGSYIICSSGSSGLSVIDISNPTDPRVVGSYGIGEHLIWADLKDQYIHSVGEVGFSVLRMSTPSTYASDGSRYPDLPGQYELSQNYPNPFNPSSTIKYSLPTRSDVSISILNILGQRVRVLFQGTKSAGEHQVVWDGRSDSGTPVSSGVYFYRVVAGDFAESKKMVLLR